MGNYWRWVYIPMPHLLNKAALSHEIRAVKDSGRCDVMDGFSDVEAWNMYRPRQSEIKRAGEHLLARFARKSGGCKSKIQWAGTNRQPLREIRSNRLPAVLYVHCHGNSEVVGFRPLKLTPAQLVARLIRDGLPMNGRPLRIKLWSCHSGEIAAGKTQTYLAGVVDELAKSGFYNIDVYGYQGELRVNGSDRGTHKEAVAAGVSARPSVGRISANTGDKPVDDEEDEDDEGGGVRILN
jgi:hypothetical protein